MTTLDVAGRRAAGNDRMATEGGPERQRVQRPQRRINVQEDERVASVAAGSILTLLGLSRRSVPGLIVAGVGGALIYRGVTGTCPMYQALDISTAQDATAGGISVAESFTIDKPREELYQFWRNFENLPRIMSHLKSVSTIDDKRSHWVAKAPSIAGGSVAWDAEMTEDVPEERIAWRSLPGADVDSVGSVQFKESPRGTIVRIDMRYVAPAGRLGSWIAKLFGEAPEQQAREDLRNFKRVMEVGEAPTIKGQPHGSCMGIGRLFRE